MLCSMNMTVLMIGGTALCKSMMLYGRFLVVMGHFVLL